MNLERRPVPGGSKPEKAPGLTDTQIRQLEADIQCKLAVGIYAKEHPELGLEGKKLSEIPEGTKNAAMMRFIETGGAAHFREMRESNQISELRTDPEGIRATLEKLGITLQ